MQNSPAWASVSLNHSTTVGKYDDQDYEGTISANLSITGIVATNDPYTPGCTLDVFGKQGLWTKMTITVSGGGDAESVYLMVQYVSESGGYGTIIPLTDSGDALEMSVSISVPGGVMKSLSFNAGAYTRDGYYTGCGDQHEQSCHIRYQVSGKNADSLIGSGDSINGGPRDNRNTIFDGGESGYGSGRCSSLGLPRYWINTSNLNLVVSDTEYASTGLGPHLSMTRTWNSGSGDAGGSGMFGKGWGFAYQAFLTSNGVSEDSPTITHGSGQKTVYLTGTVQTNPDGSKNAAFAPVGGNLDRLSGVFKDSPDEAYYLFTEKNTKYTWRFEYQGLLEDKKLYRPVSISDRNGNTVTLNYDSNGKLKSILDAAGRMVTFVYNSENLCTGMTTPAGSATYAYDGNARLRNTTDFMGIISTFTYNAEGLITDMESAGKRDVFSYGTHDYGPYIGTKYVSKVVNAMEQSTEYGMDANAYYTDGTVRAKVKPPVGETLYYESKNGRTTRILTWGKVYSTTIYNDAGLPASVTFADGSSTTMEYDARGNQTRVVDPTGGVSLFTYDDDNPITYTDPMGNTWNYLYDEGNLVSETSPLGSAKTWTYDDKGLLTKVTLPGGAQYAFGYDAFGNAATMTDPLANITSVLYDNEGLNPWQLTDPRSNVFSFVYDANRRMTRVNLPNSHSIQYGYDCCALSSITNELGAVAHFTRDNMLRITSVTAPSGAVQTNTYNSSGNLISTKDPLNSTTTFAYDAAGRLTSLTNPLNESIALNYDTRDNLTGVTDARSNTTTFTYDKSGRVATVVDQLGKTTSTIQRDAIGRVASVTNGRGQVISREYDADGRLIRIKNNGTTAADYSWSTAGFLASVADGWGTTAFTHNAVGRTTSTTYPDGKSLYISYDKSGNISSMGYPGGLTVTYAYDSLNLPISVSFAGDTMTIAYDAAGRIASESRSNGVVSIYSYNTDGWLTGVTHNKGATTIASLSYARNAAGGITQEGGTFTLAPTYNPSTTSASFDQADGLVKWANDTCTYDLDGNLTSITGARGFSAGYDPHNRPASITIGGETTSYLYDGLGNRVRAQNASSTRIFHYDPWGRLLFETNSSGQVTVAYIYAGKLLVAQGGGGEAFSFLLRDKTGNTLALVDPNGSVAAAYAYSPDGEVVSKTGNASSTPFTYVGAFGVMDDGDGIYFMKNRYYDAVTARFLQRDPIGFAAGDANLYRYVGGNPVNRIDPIGLEWTPENLYTSSKHDWAISPFSTPQTASKSGPNRLGDSVAQANLTWGIFGTFMSTYNLLTAANPYTAAASAIFLCVSAARANSVVDRHKAYAKEDYSFEDGFYDLADPTLFFRSLAGGKLPSHRIDILPEIIKDKNTGQVISK